MSTHRGESPCVCRVRRCPVFIVKRDGPPGVPTESVHPWASDQTSAMTAGTQTTSTLQPPGGPASSSMWAVGSRWPRCRCRTAPTCGACTTTQTGTCWPPAASTRPSRCTSTRRRSEALSESALRGSARMPCAWYTTPYGVVCAACDCLDRGSGSPGTPGLPSYLISCTDRLLREP